MGLDDEEQLERLAPPQYLIDRFLRERQLEWMPWAMCRATLVMGGIMDNHERPTLLIGWCATGNLRSRARNLFVGGELSRDAEIDPSIWQALQKHPLAMTATSDSFKIPMNGVDVVAREIELHFESFKSLIQWDDDQMISALERARTLVAPLRMTNVNDAPIRTPAPTKIVKPPRGGNPGKVAEWHAFYLEVAKMIHEGAFDGLQSQTAARGLILQRTGEILSDDTIKNPFAAIWHQVLGK